MLSTCSKGKSRMSEATSRPMPSATPASVASTAFPVLLGLSFSHLLNDVMQSLIPAMYPMLKTSLALDFGQVGLITLTFQLTASLLQPLVGLYTDRKPQPYSLVLGMALTLIGLVLLSRAGSFASVTLASALVGSGSSIFHPESARMARMASGGRHGMAQSLFQVGGNAGAAIGPLLAAFVVLPNGQASVAWFGGVALIGMVLLARIGLWYSQRRRAAAKRPSVAIAPPPISRTRVIVTVGLLLMLMFSKFFYMASMGNYYTFYLIHHFAASVQHAQTLLFFFLAAVAAGTFIGGPVGDHIGRRRVILMSILGVLPFTLALPYAGETMTAVLSVIIGLILSSAFSAIIVYAQELMPGKVGTISGLFFGLAFGLGGVGAATLGALADRTSIEFVFSVCAFLPAIGLLAIFLPHIEPVRRRAAK
jgi:MFS transporter, FSR family, fosmidomycin resistance protein